MENLILALLILAGTVHAQSLIVISGSKTVGKPTSGTPTFSPGAGSYSSTQSVTISATGGSVICYNTTGSPATNGTTGCTTGTLYSGAVSVSTSETLYAVSGGTGYTDSTVASATYTISASIWTTLNTAHLWSFSESSGNRSDSVGSNTLTQNGTVLHITSGPTNIPNGVNFQTSTSNYFTFSTSPLAISVSSAPWFSVWLYCASYTGYAFPLSHTTYNTDSAMTISYAGASTNTVQLSTESGNTAWSSVPLTCPGWNHLFFVVPASGGPTMYANAVSQGAVTALSGTFDFTKVGIEGNSGNPFTGYLGQLATGTGAVTAAQVCQIYGGTWGGSSCSGGGGGLAYTP